MKNESAAESKKQLREKIKIIRAQVDSSLAEAASIGAWNVLRDLPEFKKAKTLAAFASTPSEISTYPILEGSLHLGKKLYLPRMAKGQEFFEYYPVVDLKNMTYGAFGISEPTGTQPAPFGEIDLVLVPGLAFDRSGNRLGFGKGYYDLALPKLRKNSLTIGLCYSFQFLEKVPTEPSDVPVKALLSEKGFSYCSK
jgi:5-formyltetrahydrofolate cyclo-ligase